MSLTHRIATNSNPTSASYAAIERDLRAVNETLRKELGRKDGRNDNLTKELHNLRTLYTSSQRELRLLTGTFDKLNTERYSLSAEVQKSKIHLEKLETQLLRVQEPLLLSTQLDQQQHALENALNQVEKMKIDRNTHTNRIKQLERELDILHRSLELQKEYESGSTNDCCYNCNGCNSDTKQKLRSLYYELGKRQTDNHSLALSLAEAHRVNECMKEDVKILGHNKEESSKEICRLKSHIEVLLQQSKVDGDELEQVNEKANCLKGINNRLQKQLEDLSYQFSSHKTATEAEIVGKNKQIADLNEGISTLKAYCDSQQNRVDSLQQSIAHMDSVSSLSESRLKMEWDNLNGEKSKHAERLRIGDIAVSQVDALKHELSKMQSENEESVRNYKALVALLERNGDEEQHQLQSTQQQLLVVEKQLQKSVDGMKQILSERDDAMKALLQTVDATRDLSNRYQKERERRIIAEDKYKQSEKQYDTLRRSQENVSTAVLDALHKERSKTQAIEKVLHSMSIDNNKYIKHNSYMLPPPASPEPSRPPKLMSPPKHSLVILSNAGAYVGNNDGIDNGDDYDSSKDDVTVCIPPVVGMVQELKRLHDELKTLDSDPITPMAHSYYSNVTRSSNASDDNPFLFSPSSSSSDDSK